MNEPELFSAEAQRRALHELRVHQLELETQNLELRRIHEELELSQVRYFDLYDQAPVGYCTVSDEGRILEANRTAHALLGTDRGELVGQPFTQFIHGPDQDLFYLHRKELLKGEGAQPCDLRMVRKDGTVVWIQLTTTSARLPASPGLRIVLGDIGTRKRLEEENVQLVSSLHEAQKLEALGVIAGGVAHDFNNLLTTIVGNAGLGLLTAPEGELADCFNTIERAAMRAADLTRQLLAYAGKGKLLVAELDLGMLVQEVALLLAVSIPAGVSLRCDLADGLPLVNGDITLLFQVVLNLVTNAAEAFPAGAGGRITVRTRVVELDQAAIASGRWSPPLAPGRYVTLEVQDSGAGMTAEVSARAFEPFYTTKFTGRGLGLAAVIGTLRSHGGSLQVRSEPGEGSSFTLYLPAI